jgi:Tfp pilus assembly protein PilX
MYKSMSRISGTTKLNKSQDGVVSLLVTMVLMIVISLIALGFAQIARRNQGAQLDQQLSTQAFYAAESGVNDAAQIVSAQLQAGVVSPSQMGRTTCTDAGTNNIYSSLNTNSALGAAADNIAYTCVLVDPTPPTLETDIGTTSKIIPVSASSNISDIKLMWSTNKSTTTPANGCPHSVTLPTATAWGSCGVGVLRVDLVPTDGGSPADAATLAKETMTFFVVPMAPGSAGATNAVTYTGANASTGNTHNIVGVICQNTTANCTVKVDTSSVSHQNYYLRVSSEYEDSLLQITADNASGTALPLSGSQVIIDSTGKAQDVVRRIQVYVPIGLMSNQLSDYAIESTDSVCKRFAVMTNHYIGTELTGLGVNDNNPTLNPLCQ